MPGDAICIRLGVVVFVDPQARDALQVCDLAGEAADNRLGWFGRAVCLPDAKSRIGFDFRAGRGLSRIRHTDPAVCRCRNLRDRVRSRLHCARVFCRGRHRDPAFGRNRDRRGENPHLAECIPHAAVVNTRADAPSDEEVDKRLRGRTAPDAVDLYLAREAFACGCMRAVGVKDRGTQAREVVLRLCKVRDELSVLAVRIEINVRAVDPRKGVPVKGHLSINRINRDLENGLARLRIVCRIDRYDVRDALGLQYPQAKRTHGRRFRAPAENLLQVGRAFVSVEIPLAAPQAQPGHHGLSDGLGAVEVVVIRTVAKDHVAGIIELSVSHFWNHPMI